MELLSKEWYALAIADASAVWLGAPEHPDLSLPLVALAARSLRAQRELITELH